MALEGGADTATVPSIDPAASADVDEDLDPMERHRWMVLERERERRQREANEETTKSEDLANLRQQLQQMRLQQEPSSGGRFYVYQPQPLVTETQPSGDVDSYRNIGGAGAGYDAVGPGGPESQQAYYTEMHTEAPDGGWGWFVVLGSFLFMCLVDGICFNYGLLVSEMMTYFSVNVDTIGLAMLPGSLITGMYILTGPFANLMANNFGYRRVALIGSLCATVAFAVSFFLGNFYIFMFFFGIIGGVGFGLIYLPAIAIVGSWFQQRRAMAVGLALCGSGFGTLVFGQTTPLAFADMSFPQLIIVWASVSAQCLLVVVFFRPLDVHQRILLNSQARKRAKEEKRQRQLKAREEEEKKRLAKVEQQKKKKKRIVIHRGSIMQRIIEEKRRQRTTSIGSLDGMVITKDNELVEALPGQYVNPIMSSTTLNRIAETILKRRRASLLRKERQTDASRDNVCLNKENMTQLVHGYVSQLSLQQGGPLATGSRQLTANNSQTALAQLSETGNDGQLPPQPPRKKISVTSAYVPHTSELEQVMMPLSECNSDGRSQCSLTSSQVHYATGHPNVDELNDTLKAEIQTEVIKELNRPQFRKDTFFAGSFNHIPMGDGGGGGGMAQHRSQLSLQQAGLGPAVPYLSTQTSLPPSTTGAGAGGAAGGQSLEKENVSLLRDFFGEMFDQQLLSSPTFLLLVFACICSMLGFFVPFHYFPIYLGASRLHEGGCIISSMGVANIVGRLLATIYIEKNISARWSFLDCLWIHNSALLVASVSIGLVAISSRLLWPCVVLASIYSLCMAAFISLKSILVVELFGIGRLTNAFSWLLLFQGISVILSTPVALVLKQATDNIHVPFLFSAGCILLSALCHMPLRFVADWERHRLEKCYNFTGSEDMEYEMGAMHGYSNDIAGGIGTAQAPQQRGTPTGETTTQWRMSGSGGGAYRVTSVPPNATSASRPASATVEVASSGVEIGVKEGHGLLLATDVIEEEHEEDVMNGSSTHVVA